MYCSSQIQFTVDQPLACLPSSVSSNDDFVIPSGSVYAPSFVQNTVIQEFITINNININEIIINVINISNNTIIPKPPTVSLWPWPSTLLRTRNISSIFKSLAWSCSACAIASLCLQVCSGLEESIACEHLWWANQAYMYLWSKRQTLTCAILSNISAKLSECIRPIRPIDGKPKKEGQQYWFFWGTKA